MNYRAIIKPKGMPDNWILDGIEGNNIKEFLKEVDKYLKDLGVKEYEIISVRKVRLRAVAFDDIALN